MFNVVLVIVGILIASIAYAEQPAPMPQAQPSAFEQALSNKIFNEMNANVQCNTQLITVKQQFDAANARIKELEANAKPADTAPQPSSAPKK